MKRAIWMGMLLGSTLGGLIPNLWGAGLFSFSSLFLSTLGAMLGIFVAYRLTR